jgi:hypothetical protein
MNIEEEKIAFKIFLELFGKLPPGEKSERPDFIIYHNSKKIGVELTELMEEKVKTYSSAAQYSLEDKIAKSAQVKYDSISERKIAAHLRFVENFNLALKDVDTFAAKIAKLIYENVKELPYVLRPNYEILDDLPKQISGVYFDIAPFMIESHFSVWRGKWGNLSFNIDFLNKSINKKERSINQYLKNVDQIYLLIIEGYHFSGYLGQFEFKGSLAENHFDKIFLLQIMSRQIHVIK